MIAPRTDVVALSDFLARVAEEDEWRFRAARDAGEPWVSTGPNSMSSTSVALDDHQFLMDWIAEHCPVGPGLCEPCSVHYDQPVRHPCPDIRGTIERRWGDRPGWWPGWSNRDQPGPPGRGDRWQARHRAHHVAAHVIAWTRHLAGVCVEVAS